MRRAALIKTDAAILGHLADSLGTEEAPIVAPPASTASASSLRHRVQGHVRLIERDAVVGALSQAGGNKAEAARLLGIDYKTYRRKLKMLGAAQDDPL